MGLPAAISLNYAESLFVNYPGPPPPRKRCKTIYCQSCCQNINRPEVIKLINDGLTLIIDQIASSSNHDRDRSYNIDPQLHVTHELSKLQQINRAAACTSAFAGVADHHASLNVGDSSCSSLQEKLQPFLEKQRAEMAHMIRMQASL
ncbi:hypothetical protein GOP47_0030896 [Adiantum capillus-veneris]|nr:hypothetical protein GOP47_0030896 [Adiantum capillus-veneris]